MDPSPQSLLWLCMHLCMVCCFCCFCVWCVASVVCCSCCMTRHTAFCYNSHGCNVPIHMVAWIPHPMRQKGPIPFTWERVWESKNRDWIPSNKMIKRLNDPVRVTMAQRPCEGYHDMWASEGSKPKGRSLNLVHVLIIRFWRRKIFLIIKLWNIVLEEAHVIGSGGNCRLLTNSLSS